MDCFVTYWDAPGAAEQYRAYPWVYVTTAVTKIIEFYRVSHPAWSPGLQKIPVIVDVGCGSGQLTAPLSEFCERIVGVDASQAQIELARKINAGRNVKYKAVLAEDLPMFFERESVDLIVCGQSVHFFDNPCFYASAIRCLKADGVLALAGFFQRGIQHEITDYHSCFSFMWSQVRGVDGVIDHSICLLSSQYKELTCPFPRVVRWSSELVEEMSREELRSWLMSVSHLYLNARENIDAMVDNLPPMETYNVMIDVFFSFYQN